MGSEDWFDVCLLSFVSMGFLESSVSIWVTRVSSVSSLSSCITCIIWPILRLSIFALVSEL